MTRTASPEPWSAICWPARPTRRVRAFRTALHGRFDERRAVGRIPFGGARQKTELAAVRPDQKARRQARRPALGLEVLEDLQRGVPVVREVVDSGVAEERFDLFGAPGIEIDRDGLEFAAA